jgi:arginine/lysine/ornithine decarboxylase
MNADRRFSAGHGEKKPRKLDAFVVAMLAHPTVEAAAASVGIAASTAYRWLQHADVIQRLAEARRDVMKAVMSRLQQAAAGSVDCLCQVQREGESESARVSAARTILEQALRAVELQEVQERIEKLEAIVKSRNWKGSGNEQSTNRTQISGARRINGHG